MRIQRLKNPAGPDYGGVWESSAPLNLAPLHKRIPKHNVQLHSTPSKINSTPPFLWSSSGGAPPKRGAGVELVNLGLFTHHATDKWEKNGSLFYFCLGQQVFVSPIVSSLRRRPPVSPPSPDARSHQALREAPPPLSPAAVVPRAPLRAAPPVAWGALGLGVASAASLRLPPTGHCCSRPPRGRRWRPPGTPPCGSRSASSKPMSSASSRAAAPTRRGSPQPARRGGGAPPSGLSAARGWRSAAACSAHPGRSEEER